jgi:photosystem II stability/assembly factor-like uncharacterized protein
VGGLPTTKRVNNFAVDPANPKVMYVVVDGGLFKTTDAGSTWKGVGNNFKDLTTVAVNPKKPSEIYGATARGILFRSADGGTKWKRQS